MKCPSLQCVHQQHSTPIKLAPLIFPHSTLSLTFTSLSTPLLQAPPFFLTQRFYLRVQQNALNSCCKGRCINNFMIFRDGNIESCKKGGKNHFFSSKGVLASMFSTPSFAIVVCVSQPLSCPMVPASCDGLVCDASLKRY